MGSVTRRAIFLWLRPTSPILIEPGMVKTITTNACKLRAKCEDCPRTLDISILDLPVSERLTEMCTRQVQISSFPTHSHHGVPVRKEWRMTTHQPQTYPMCRTWATRWPTAIAAWQIHSSGSAFSVHLPCAPHRRLSRLQCEAASQDWQAPRMR